MGSDLSAAKPIASIVRCDVCGTPQASTQCCAHCGAALPVVHSAPSARSERHWAARLSAIAAVGAIALVPISPDTVRTDGLITRFEAESLRRGMPLEEVRSRLGRPYLVLDKTPVDLPSAGERVWGPAGRWYRHKRANETVWVYTTRQDDLIEVVFRDGKLERVPFIPVAGANLR